jgi:hypothetical protein
MLRITVQDDPGCLRFDLEGKLAGPWVQELHACWQAALAGPNCRRAPVIGLREVDFVDAAGQVLLAEMRRAGVCLEGASPFIEALLAQPAAPPRYATVEGKPVRRPHASVPRNRSGPPSGSL